MNATLMIRRCFCAFTTPSYSPTSNTKKPLVFLGSPEVSTKVLEALFTSSESSASNFQVVVIVTQPPSARNRGRKVLPSPVAQYALDRGFPADLIFTPERAGEDGVKETGVSLAFTVRALDAGPVIAHERFVVDDNIKAPELLDILFGLGSKLLAHELPSILDGSARANAQPQDDSKATLAPKITPEESWLSFDQEAYLLHNKVRALAGWPGTRARVQVVDSKNGGSNPIEIKIITTRVATVCSAQTSERDAIIFNKGVLVFPCAEQTALEVLEVQLPGKKVSSAAAFWNGLRGQKLQIF